jgi:hypothetical protein
MVLQEVSFSYKTYTPCVSRYNCVDFFLNFRISALIIELVKSTPFLNQVMIIATAINGKSLHPRLYYYESSHLFTCELIIPPLTNVSVM